ncbi:heparan-alpha-glucosaminide N-acetyltransferase [Chthonobacter albigriseus]|uniref:heparan-alpha-glucosaminide N-acetyltransferase n=1 Tax=Chthonobacter albigriseus TaxID=1683161 RepID=UPI0015EEE22F|nr:heparan-alpha-glucosaminide N-acetyltransferase [Chthonobacter albigriseus]
MSDSRPLPRRVPRIPLIDALRGIAVVAMVVYHFSWDLSYHHFVTWDVVGDPVWRGFAMSIAASFLVLVGVSLSLAAAEGLSWRRILARLARIAAGAVLVSLATYALFPDAWVRFGILHMIAAGSVLALPFPRLPTAATLAVAVLVLLAPRYLTSEAFDHPLLVWTGLQATVPPANDFVPVFPWLAAVLAGVAAGRLIARGSLPLPFWSGETAAGRVLRWLGRWSLLIYLVHQPLLFGITAGFAMLMPADPEVERAKFVGACRLECTRESGNPEACQGFCSCVAASLDGTSFWTVRGGDPDLASLVSTAASGCRVPPDGTPLPP